MNLNLKGRMIQDVMTHPDYRGQGYLHKLSAICLEDMNLHNGALEVFHESHKLGTLPHVRRSESSSGDGLNGK